MSEFSEPEIGVVSLNLLLNKTLTREGVIEPQHERIKSLAHTIGSLPVSLDVVMVQELHITDKHHNGELLQEQLGLQQGYWFGHNENSRKNEFLGVLGNAIEAAESIDVGDNRKAVIAHMGGVAFVGIHHRSGLRKGPVRLEQMQSVMQQVSDFDKVVVMGDSNDYPASRSRRILREYGFTSVFRALGGPNPPTFPTPDYRDIMLTKSQKRIVPRGISIDIIETRGFERDQILAAGVQAADKSDHYALHARLAA